MPLISAANFASLVELPENSSSDAQLQKAEELLTQQINSGKILFDK